MLIPVVSMLLLLSFSQYAGASDKWPMYQANPSHTGFVPVTLDPAKFALRWSKQLGDLALNPVTAANGRVFVSESSYFGSPSLYVIDSSSGEISWSINFGDVYSANPPSYSDGKVYIQTVNHEDDTYLRAYDAVTGALVFRSNHGAQWENYYAPTIYKGNVYINGGGYGGMYAFDGRSGRQEWFSELPYGDQWTPAVDENSAYAYLGGGSPELYVLDRLTGQLIFEIPNPNFDLDYNSMNLAPVLGGLSDVFAIQDRRLIRFDLQARDISWVNTENFGGQPTVSNGMVYALNAGALGVYDQETGASQWMWEAPGGQILHDTIIVTNSHLFVSSDSNTYSIDLTTHQQAWSYPSAGYLSLGESTLYIAASDGTLTAISLGLPDLSVPESVVFGRAGFGETVTRSIPMSNVGDETLEVRNIVSSSGEFVAQSVVLPLTIGPHQSVSVDVEFTLVEEGKKSGNLLITSNDPNEPEMSVSLKGESNEIHSINAVASAGGQISPSGSMSILDGDSLSLTITPNSGYQLVSLLVDGVTIASQSAYTFNNIVSDHTIMAVFALDYFGMQDGNHFELSLTDAGGTDDIGTRYISLDTSSFPDPCYMVEESFSDTSSNILYQVFSNRLFMKQRGGRVMAHFRSSSAIYPNSVGSKSDLDSKDHTLNR
jgi:outer membrane protein assembly factor BamB